MSNPGVFSDNDLDFMPQMHRASRRRGRRFAYLLTIMIFVFFVVMGAWSQFAMLDEVTRGEGKVIPSSKTQVIQNLEGGILADILVREGDIVEEGAILVRIDNTAAKASYEDIRGQYLALKATEARLDAELNQADEVSFPEEAKQGAAAEVAGQKRLFNARRRQLNAQISVLDSQARQRSQEIEELISRRNQLERSLKLAKEELGITQPLVEKGVLPKLDLIRMQRQVADLEGEIRTIKKGIPRLTTAFEEAMQRVEEMVLTTRAEVSDELNRVRTELSSLSQTLFAGEDRVTRTEVRSLVRGTVKELKYNTIGGVISPGADIIEIVPLDDTLLVEAEVRPADIAFLRPGQMATIKVSAYDFSVYGGLKARLETISADTIKDENGESFYRVYLRTDVNVIKHQGAELPIIPGMTATAEILTGKKTVLDYLMKPILKARDRALKER